MSKQLEMSEVERKFIMMSRIAVLLSRKGFNSNPAMHQYNGKMYCAMYIHYLDECEMIESDGVTEAELLEWWTILDNEVQ